MTVIDCLASLKGEEGKFVLQNDRINWTSSHQQISIPLQQIKLLHVNQTSTSQQQKVLLKVTPIENAIDLDKSGYLFNFASNPNSIALRDQIKDRLTEGIAYYKQQQETIGKSTESLIEEQSTPQPISNLNQEERRCREILLSQDQSLALLHRSLAPNSIEEEEFWTVRKSRIEEQKEILLQQRGITPLMVGEMKREQQLGIDNSTLRFVLTPQLIQTIFIQFPAVHQAFRENVPERMKEKDFWSQYFTSKYFGCQQTEGEDSLFDLYFQKELEIREREQIEKINNLTLSELESQYLNEELPIKQPHPTLIKSLNLQSTNILNSFVKQKTNILRQQLQTTTDEEKSIEHNQSRVTVIVKEIGNQIPIEKEAEPDKQQLASDQQMTSEQNNSTLYSSSLTATQWNLLIQPKLGPQPQIKKTNSSTNSERISLLKEYLKHFWLNYPTKGNQEKKNKIDRLVILLKEWKKRVTELIEYSNDMEKESISSIDKCIQLATTIK